MDSPGSSLPCYTRRLRWWILSPADERPLKHNRSHSKRSEERGDVGLTSVVAIRLLAFKTLRDVILNEVNDLAQAVRSHHANKRFPSFVGGVPRSGRDDKLNMYRRETQAT